VEDSENYLLADFLNGTATTFLAVDHADPDLPKEESVFLSREGASGKTRFLCRGEVRPSWIHRRGSLAFQVNSSANLRSPNGKVRISQRSIDGHWRRKDAPGERTRRGMCECACRPARLGL